MLEYLQDDQIPFPEQIMTTFGVTLRTLREQKQLTQGDIADKLQSYQYDIKRQNISQWENGSLPAKYAFDARFLRALAHALDMSEVELLIALGFEVGPPSDVPPFALSFALRVAELADLPEKELDEALDRLNAVFKAAGF